MITSILCALDMSQARPNDRTLTAAADLARHYGAQLDVVSVIPDLGVGEVSSFFPDGYQEKALKQAIETLKAHVGAVLGEAANAAVRHEVAVGKVYEQVLRVAEEADSSLIVVGSHQPGLRDYLIGSNASRIVRHAHCSVYVVR
jgi:nucleotide-binding universal stress UspA family protein